eukprot:symbB.v1.2.039588.t1/scaffold6451.1/size17988/3
MLHRRRQDFLEDPMSSMERGSRSGEASQAAELALVPVGRSEQKSSNGNQTDGSGPGKESTQSGQLELEDIPDRPVGRPEVLGPKQLEPLFNEEQVRQAEELEASAPMLQDRRKTSLASEGTGWEGGLRREDHGGAHQELEVRARKGSGVTPPAINMPAMGFTVPPTMVSPTPGPMGFPSGFNPMQFWAEDQMRMQVQLQQEVMALSQTMKSLQEENVRLRVQLVERETKYSTPPDAKTIERTLRTTGRSSRKKKQEDGQECQQEASKEDGLECRQETSKEDGLERRQDTSKEDGQECQQDTSKEDGQECRQETSKEDGQESQQEASKEDGSENQQDEERSEDDRSSEEEAGRGRGDRRGPVSDDAFNTMLKIMQGMQKMQQQMLKHKDKNGKNRGESVEDETLRGGIDLHLLPEWSPDTAPVDLQDWLLLVDTQMCDISASSHEWWALTLETAKKWYKKHQSLKPIEKLQHKVSLTLELQQAKWKRLERRASNLLLRALPESQREDIIAGKDLSVLAILTKLMVNYQPGGGQEKAAVLAALELPAEANTMRKAINGLRKWLRWKKRAVDMGLVRSSNLQFRINLTRTTLMIDAVPTMSGIEQLAECIMAELDQVSYAKKKAALQAPKVRRLEEFGKNGHGGRKADEERKEIPKCKFYLTEEGCRRGRGCRFSHDQKDELKRCWACGSTKHFSNKCPVKEGTSSPSPPKVAKAEKPKDENKTGRGDDEEVQSNKAAMGEDSKSTTSIGRAQGWNDEGAGRLARVQPCDEEMGLLDSGATHCLRPQFSQEDVSNYVMVKINLAGGQCAELRMSPGKVIVGSKDVEPIVPLGHLVSRLGCNLQWTQDGLVVVHPVRGQIPTSLKDGCPMINKKLALKLIQELEDLEDGSVRLMMEESDPIVKWIQRLAEEHPVFKDLPERSKVYAGGEAKGGFTYERAVKELGGDHRKVIQIDIKNGDKWDMVNGKVYEELLSMAIEGQISSVLTSPNCRTRSKLRHIQVPGMNLPGPARCWNGGEWGVPDGSAGEKRKCWEDDVMMFRSWMVYIVAQECNKAEGKKEDIDFVLEHPSPPEDMPEVVSIWRTTSWDKLKKAYNLKEVEVDQGDLGSGAIKPTTLGTNLKLEFPKIALVETEDVNRKKAKYVLVGTFTWPTGGVGEDVEDKVEEEEEEEVKDGEAVLQLEDVKDQGEEEAEGEIRAAKRGEEGEESDQEDEGPEDGEGEEVEESSVSGAHGDELGQPEEEVEERKEAQVRVHRMAIPLPSKNADDILRGVADLYLMLRSEGMYVRQIHSDLGREFKGQGLAKWCMERGVLQTFTSGADPQGNGRAERAVQAMKIEVRKMLRSAEVGVEFWPLAVEDEERKETKANQDRVMYEEAARLVYDDVEVAPIVAEGINMMQSKMEEPEEEILQTKIVSPAEVKQKIEKWRKAIEAEIDSLFNIKKALRLVEKEELRRMMNDQGVAPLPSEVIFTLKPDGNNPQGKRKCRIVACGNYAAPEEEANYFAAGADAASLRLVLALGARKGWGGYNMDVRTAFLNTPWKGEKKFEDSDEEDEMKPVVIKPPGILVTLGYFTADQGWEVHRALYGFRQSPKLWSDYRDQQLELMKVSDYYLKQLESESCIWLVKKIGDEEVHGALVWGYLAGTLKEGLVFQGVGGDLMVYTDASFGEEEAHGCVVVKWGEDPLIWRSSRQGMLTTSTAEAELVEVMEGAVTTEALRVMVEEVLERPVRCWQFTDSSSALTIIIGDTASWRTRHLRKRAKFLRWKALRGDILMRHQPGSEMVADIGTKPLSAVKLKEHKKRLGMNLQESEVKKKESPSTESTKKEGGRLRLALMMALIARGKAQKEGEKIKEGWEIEALILLYTVFVVMITVAFQAWCRWRSQKKKGLEDHTEEDPVCGLTPGLKKKPAKGIEERTEEEPVRGLSHEVEEDLRKRSKEDTGEPTVSKVQPTSQKEERKEERATASSGGQVPNLPSEAFQRNKLPRESDAPSRGTSWMVAGNGLRYHRLRHCTGVKMSKQVRDVMG